MKKDKIDQEKPFKFLEQHPLLDPSIEDGHDWKFRLWKYESGWPLYYSFDGDTARKQIKQKIKTINNKFEARLKS